MRIIAYSLIAIMSFGISNVKAADCGYKKEVTVKCHKNKSLSPVNWVGNITIYNCGVGVFEPVILTVLT